MMLVLGLVWYTNHRLLCRHYLCYYDVINPSYYDVTNPLHYAVIYPSYYDVTNPSTMTSLT